MYLVTADEMRKMDQKTIEEFGIPGRVLMENAGKGATQILLDQFPGLVRKKIGIVAGRGNNGGDGFVMARYLFQKGIAVTVFLLSDKKAVRGDAEANLNLLGPLGVPLVELRDQNAFDAHKTLLCRQDLWVDAILGTGLQSEVKDYFKHAIDFINHSNQPIFAVDIPSGLNSDTGQPCGTCVRAHVTATFGFAKIGHFIHPGADLSGNVEIVDIGIPPFIVEAVGPKQFLLTRQGVRSGFEPRPRDAHKGNTGHLLIVAGSPGKTGAAAMTAIAAMRTGSGLVTLAVPKNLNPVLETQVLEAMTCPLAETVDGMLDESSFDAIMGLLKGKKCMAIGPGLGTAEETSRLVHRLVQESSVPVVIDADGLNSLEGYTHILKKLRAPAVLTPHPGEMARLVNMSPAEVQKDRVSVARDFARAFHLNLVLKGAKTIVAHPDGTAYINPTGNAGMASGGMGDVLTGIIAGLIAQGVSPESAARIGVYLHGAAGDFLEKTMGPVGFLASDVMNTIPGQIKTVLLDS